MRARLHRELPRLFHAGYRDPQILVMSQRVADQALQRFVMEDFPPWQVGYGRLLRGALRSAKHRRRGDVRFRVPGADDATAEEARQDYQGA